MAVNANKPERWKEDIAQSVDYYNEWFMRFAPKTYRETRTQTTAQVLSAFEVTNNLREAHEKPFHRIHRFYKFCVWQQHRQLREID